MQPRHNHVVPFCAGPREPAIGLVVPDRRSRPRGAMVIAVPRRSPLVEATRIAAATLGAVAITGALAALLVALYWVKSALGIDLFEGHSFMHGLVF